MFDISKKTHKTKNNKRITYWFVLINTQGREIWLNVEKKRKKRKLRKEEDDKLKLKLKLKLIFFWKMRPP